MVLPVRSTWAARRSPKFTSVRVPPRAAGRPGAPPPRSVAGVDRHRAEGRGRAGRGPSRPAGPARRPSARTASGRSAQPVGERGEERLGLEPAVAGPRQPAAGHDPARPRRRTPARSGRRCQGRGSPRAACGARRIRSIVRPALRSAASWSRAASGLLVAVFGREAAHAFVEMGRRGAADRLLEPHARLLDRVGVAVEPLAAAGTARGTSRGCPPGRCRRRPAGAAGRPAGRRSRARRPPPPRPGRASAAARR